MDEIEQKKENLYQKYLKEKLDLIFSEETGIPINSYIFKHHLIIGVSDCNWYY